jgi:type IV pilus assembly protein PilA
MKNKLNQGFTLIELLVVIAIIGVLSSVVLASLNTARGKGADSSIKANLANARAQAELFYADNGEVYSGTANVCSSTATSGGTKSVQGFITAAASIYGYTTVAADFLSTKIGNTTTATCHGTATRWAAEVPLKTGGMWCVDSDGTSKYNAGTGLGAASDTTC